ncbi:MAG: hypothetical protein JWP87_6507 [Labilithrix sp.]|jgi:hypothetical protein|nr:hypothetical protein [Labilithrix sp.]
MAAGIVLLLAREASATGAGASASSVSKGVQWYVETIGAPCEGQRSALEREIKLACDALGGACSTTPVAKETELRAVLDCSAPSGADDSWTLVTRTIDGTVLASLDLSGPQSDRLRQAAVEVARDVAPERSLAMDALRYSLGDEKDDKPAPAATKPARLSLLVGGRVSGGSGAPGQLGGHLLAGLTLARSFHGTLGFTAMGGGNAENAMRTVGAGAGISIGAPFDRSALFGFAAEGGMANVSTYALPKAASSAATFVGGSEYLATVNVLSGYAQGTVTFQWPGLSVRPFASLSAGAQTAAPHIAGTGEAGVAFALF